MGPKRHTITNTLEQTGGKIYGNCTACDQVVRVYRVREYTLKDGTTIMQYRCRNQMRKYQYRTKHLNPKKNVEVQKRDVMESIPSSLAAQIQRWDETQGGHCGLCSEYVRRGRNRGRDMYAVTDTQGSVIPGLFCWDCRNLLHQRITGAMEMAITNVLSKDRLRLTPPTGVGR